jgi:hypothetical protein
MRSSPSAVSTGAGSIAVIRALRGALAGDDEADLMTTASTSGYTPPWFAISETGVQSLRSDHVAAEEPREPRTEGDELVSDDVSIALRHSSVTVRAERQARVSPTSVIPGAPTVPLPFAYLLQRERPVTLIPGVRRLSRVS